MMPTFVQLVIAICSLTLCKGEISLSPELLLEFQLDSEPDVKSNVYESYNRVIRCHPAERTQYPKSIPEVQKLVLYAIEHDLKVKSVGSKHSATDIICTDGLPIDMSLIKHINWDSAEKKVTVGAGMELGDLLEYLADRNRSLTGMPSPGVITVGGALAVGAHGSTLTHPSRISDQVISMKIIDGLGNLRLINDTEELRAFKVNLGLLGIIVEATFTTVPQYKVKITNYEMTEDVLFDGTVLEMARSFDTFSFWWLPNEQSVVVGEGTFEGTDVRGNASTNLLPNLAPWKIVLFGSIIETLQGLRKRPGLTFFEDLSQRSLHQFVFGMPQLYSEGANGKKLVNPAVGYSHRMLTNKCSTDPRGECCVWSLGKASLNPEVVGFAMDVKYIPDIVNEIKEILKLSPAEFLLSSIWFRFSRPSDSYMAIENGRETVHVNINTPRRVHQYNSPRMGLAAFQAIFQSWVDKFGARSHWGESSLYYHNRQLLEENFAEKPLFVENMTRTGYF